MDQVTWSAAIVFVHSVAVLVDQASETVGAAQDEWREGEDLEGEWECKGKRKYVLNEVVQPSVSSVVTA